MENEILRRKFFNKIKIIIKLYIYPIIIAIALIISFFFIPDEIIIKLFQNKRAILKLTSSNFRNLALFFIGIVVGSYSIVQALLDNESLKVLTKNEGKGSSKFTDINIYFYSYVNILLLMAFFNAMIEIFLSDSVIQFVKNIEFIQEKLKFIFKLILSLQFITAIPVAYEFQRFVRNLYDTFKVTTYIKMTSNKDTREKIIIINEYLFDKNLINYLSDNLTEESYEKMKSLLGKDFTLKEAIEFIEKEKNKKES